MKHIFIAFLLLIVVAGHSQTITKKIDTTSSTIIWKGEKRIGDAHVGTIKLLSGTLLFKKGKIAGGEFLIDMTSINCTDLIGKGKIKLEKHLNSDNFFGVKNYPKATFSVQKALFLSDNQYQITGDFTIKGKTNPNTFILTVTDDNATGTILIRRDLYGIRYGSGFFGSIANKVISNIFILDFNLTF